MTESKSYLNNNLVQIDKNDNTIASIIAYFFAKFSDKAIKALGYSTAAQAFSELSILTGSKPNYIKLRRDEFDPLIPESPRLGWHKRPATTAVLKFHKDLQNLSYDELLFKVKTLLDIQKFIEPELNPEVKKEILNFNEIEIENMINFKDESAAIKLVSKTVKQRIVDAKIVDKLKQFYNYRCQICGQRHYDTYATHIAEGHHILPFIESLNNNASNIIILCPNHHRLMHSIHPTLDLEQKIYTYPNGYLEHIQINDHL